MTNTSRDSKFTHNISNIMAKRIGETTAVQMIRMLGFLQKLSTIDDVTRYRGMSVSRYFLRRYIIVGLFLIPRIPSAIGKCCLWLWISCQLQTTCTYWWSNVTVMWFLKQLVIILTYWQCCRRQGRFVFACCAAVVLYACYINTYILPRI